MLLRKLWNDELGATVSLETVMVGTVGVLAVTGGIATLADAINDELDEMALAVRGFNQSYTVSGYSANGTIQTGVPCTGGSVASTTYQSFKAGSGFQQSPPNFNVQQTGSSGSFSSNVSNFQADVAGTVGGQQFQNEGFGAGANSVLSNGGGGRTTTRSFTVPGVEAPLNNGFSVQTFNDNVEILQDGTAAPAARQNGNSAAAARRGNRANAAGNQDCPQPASGY